jgi:hypothetical protein
MKPDDIAMPEWLKLNASLQQKKNALRKKLTKMGVLKKGGQNDFDHYSYFSEAQYKQLFTQLFSECGLEIKFTELEYGTFDGTGKQCNGRMPRIEFTLFDIDTGFYETTIITGEGMDKGDKAGYKAYTGALKYFLADTFMVATGDDPEKDSPDQQMNQRGVRKASEKQLAILRQHYQGGNLMHLLEVNNIGRLEDLPMAKASELISKLNGGN